MSLRAGDYVHHAKSGNYYKIICVSCDADNAWRVLVIYEALYHNNINQTWVREYSEFFQEVVVDGQTTTRFKKIPYWIGLIKHMQYLLGWTK